MKLNHSDAITLEDTIVDCPVRCLPCRHPFEAENLLQWLGSTVSYEYNPNRREHHTKCPVCNTEVENVELMSTELVKRWNTMTEKYTEAEEVLREANESTDNDTRKRAEKALEENKFGTTFLVKNQ